MNRTTKYLVGLGVSGTLLAVAAMAALKAPQHPVAVAGARSAPEANVVPESSVPVQTAAAATVAPEPPVDIPLLPANAANVPDDDLLRLSASVNLANASDRSIDKERWAQVVPIAEKLVQGPCDCEQRNWLNHFIAMGQAARTGANEQYYQLAGLMVKLARNDKQLADDPTRSLR